VAEVATVCKSGLPAQANNCENASANAARAAGSGASSQAFSEIVPHLLHKVSRPRNSMNILNENDTNVASLRHRRAFQNAYDAKFLDGHLAEQVLRGLRSAAENPLITLELG
jgi:hypothetical protein